MANITDLRLADYPTMTLVLPDGTAVHICAPTVELVEELRRSNRKLNAVLQGAEGDDKLKKAVYELAAKLINCNEDAITVTAESLAVQHRASLKALQVFYQDYTTFLSSLEHAKN